MRIDVSILIVNYNTSDLIIECIKSIFEKTHGLAFEIIIIDNNSEKDFQEKIEKNIGKRNEMRYLALSENIGFGRANNEGLKMVRGRNILFLNPDTILINNAIKILLDFLDHNPKVGACGGNLKKETDEPTFSYYKLLPGIRWELNELLNNIPQKIFLGKIDHFYNTSNEPVKVKYIYGADLMVRKEILIDLSGFSNDFFMFYEETDLCYRILKAGWEIYNVPEALIIHLEGKSFYNSDFWASPQRTRQLEESRKIYYIRNKSRFLRFLCNCIYFTFLGSRIILIRNKKKNQYYQYRMRCFLN